MYYVYEWFIVETGEIIYVGKGSNIRYKVRKHNRLFNEMIKRFECDSRIVKEFENEKDAFEYEYLYINKLKANGQCVCNINKGGAGGTTEWWTDELRRRYSEKNVMKSESQRKRMSENNPMKNPDIAQKTNSQKKKPVIIGENQYESIKTASEKLNVCKETIVSWCKKGVNSNGEQCRFKDCEQVVFSDKRFNKGTCRSLTYKNKHYESAVDLADEIGMSKYVVYRWLKKGFDYYGNECKYDNDERKNVFVRKPGSNYPVIVNGTRYLSINQASKAIGIDGKVLRNILNGKTKSKKYTCEYDNQQPSHGNTDNSTVEGSTTNG